MFILAGWLAFALVFMKKWMENVTMLSVTNKFIMWPYIVILQENNLFICIVNLMSGGAVTVMESLEDI